MELVPYQNESLMLSVNGPKGLFTLNDYFTIAGAVLRSLCRSMGVSKEYICWLFMQTPSKTLCVIPTEKSESDFLCFLSFELMHY